MQIGTLIEWCRQEKTGGRPEWATIIRLSGVGGWPSVGTSSRAEHALASDRLQPTLLRRFGFRRRL